MEYLIPLEALLLLLLAAILSGLESALLTVDRARIRTQAATREREAIQLEHLYNHRQEVLVAVLAVSHACAVLAYALTASAFVRWWGPVGYLLCFLIVVPFAVFALELVPKSIFQHFPYRMLRRFLPLLLVLQWLFGPAVRLGTRLVSGLAPESTAPSADLDQDREVFRALTDSVEQQGVLDKDESGLIRRVLDFEEVTAQAVMLPMREVTAVPLGMPVQQVIDLAEATHYDQFPVLSQGGDLVGVVRLFDLLQLNDRDGVCVHNILRQPVRTAPNEKALRVLQRMRQAHVELAIVSDPAGRALGIVGSQDMVNAMMNPD